jgi:hypothetical protein
MNELMMVYQPTAQPGYYKDASNESQADTRMAAALSRSFQELWEAFVKAGEEPWGSVTLVFDSGGNFTVDFGYEDFEQIDCSKWRQSWEKKYLGHLKLVE